MWRGASRFLDASDMFPELYTIKHEHEINMPHLLGLVFCVFDSVLWPSTMCKSILYTLKHVAGQKLDVYQHEASQASSKYFKMQLISCIP